MPFANPLRVLLGATLTLVLPAYARSEISVPESVGWMAADSDLVVRGKVAGLKTRKQGRTFVDTVAVNVSEVLKGKKTRKIAFNFNHSGLGETPTAWKKDGLELLLFLREHAGAYTLRRGNFGQRDSVVRLDGKAKYGVFTPDLRKHTSRTEVLKVTRAAIAQLPKTGKPKAHRIDVPAGTDAYTANYAGSAVFLVAPVNDRLQDVAKKWIESSGNFTDSSLRWEGVRALKHFKTPENVELLKKMLADDSHLTTIEGAGRNAKRIHVIRRDAYHILRSWKIDVDRPEIESPLK